MPNVLVAGFRQNRGGGTKKNNWTGTSTICGASARQYWPSFSRQWDKCCVCVFNGVDVQLLERRRHGLGRWGCNPGREPLCGPRAK